MVKIKRKICIPISTRGNYGKLKSTFKAIQKSKDLELQIIIAGGLVLDRYGDFREIIKNDGFEISGELPFLLDGDSTETISISSGLAQMQFSRYLAKLSPDIVFITADRFEALAFAQSALCMNCTIAHLEGGEVSGSIDERIRHAITKLSHIHFVSNKESAERVKLLGELEKNIIISGNPSIDLIKKFNKNKNNNLKNFLKTKEINFDTSNPYLVISQHPVVTEVSSSLDQIRITYKALEQFNLPKFWILPNIDAGNSSAHVFLKDNIKNSETPIYLINSMPFELYATLISNSKCLIGNSSSGIRESSFLGVPSVNIGNRQFGRLRGPNTLDCEHSIESISKAIKYQIDHGHYRSSNIYGDGKSGELISNHLSKCSLILDKTITY